MNQNLKQRMIGAVILAALAVIFIPMFLKGPVEQGTANLPIDIPPRPTVELEEGLAALPERSPAPDEAFSRSVPLDVEAAAVSDTETEPSEPTEPVALREPSPPPQKAVPPQLASWAVQVGSFGSESNAVRLRDKLRNNGYTAYVDAIDGDGQRFYRVRVGPVVTRDEAERLKLDLGSKQELKGMVVAHP